MIARSPSAAHFIFGACTAIAAIVCFVFIIQTKGKSLDEIETAIELAGERRPLLLGRVSDKSLIQRLSIWSSVHGGSG